MASARNIRAGAAYVELFVNDSKLVRGLENASRKLKAFGAAITGWGEKLATLGAGIVTPLLGAAKVFADMGNQMAKMSQRTGISVEALSELAYAAQLSGSDTETLEIAIRKMQKTLVEAAQGSQTATDALAQLGLTVTDLRGLSPDQQFKLIADRLAGIQSPAVKAALALALFGRSGTQLLPLMAHGAAGIEALQTQARSLGLTMAGTDAAAAEALHDSLDTLWKVLKQGVFVIGSALGPTVQALAQWIIQVVVSATRWIQENKALVVTIFKIGVSVLAAGAALIGLGAAITATGTVLGALASIIAAVGTALGVVGSILAAFATPLGVAAAAVLALGGYLVYTAGVGGKALQWLADRFHDLADFAAHSVQGISDALVAGDIALAAKILWLSLKVAWQTGIVALTKLWESLKTASLQAVYDLWYGAQAAWEIGIASVEKVMLQLYYFMTSLWENMSTGVMNVWDEAINWVAKRIIDLQGLLDKSLDTDAAKKGLDEDVQRQTTQRNQERDENLKSIEDERQAALKNAQEEHDARMAQIGQASEDTNSQLDRDAQEKIDQSQQELEQAKAEWEQAIADARKQRELHDSQAPDGVKPPPALPDLLEGLGPTLEDAQKKTIGVAGTFNALEARGLGSGGVTDRIAKAAEETARNTKQLLQEAQLGGMEFD